MRPKPTVLAKVSRPDSMRDDEILQTEAIYAVFYRGKPMNYRLAGKSDDVDHKYIRSSFGNPGHAFNLADRLSKRFKSNEFSVVMLLNGEEIEERPYERRS